MDSWFTLSKLLVYQRVLATVAGNVQTCQNMSQLYPNKYMSWIIRSQRNCVPVLRNWADWKQLWPLGATWAAKSTLSFAPTWCASPLGVKKARESMRIHHPIRWSEDPMELEITSFFWMIHSATTKLDDHPISSYRSSVVFHISAFTPQGNGGVWLALEIAWKFGVWFGERITQSKDKPRWCSNSPKESTNLEKSWWIRIRYRWITFD